MTTARQSVSRLDKWNIKKTDEFEYQVIDLFSGAGGMSAGFHAFNGKKGPFKVIGGMDVLHDACKTYEKNFQVPCLNQDVAKLLTDKGLKEFKETIGFREDKKTILIGCPPCQGFTALRKKNWDKKDPRNNLVVIFAEIAARIQPDVLIMENVPEMLSKKYWKYFESFKDILEDDNYKIQTNIYNAADFGVPQKRMRSLVIAMKKDFNMPKGFLNKDKHFTVRDAISHLPVVEAGDRVLTDAYHKSAKHKESTINVIKAVPQDGGNRPEGIGPKCLDKVRGYYDVYGRLNWDRPSITITQYARNPASGRFTHPEQHRGLTMREASLLQSFPMRFEFTGTFDSVFKQIGEAVPPRFSAAIAASIESQISDEKEYEKSDEKTT